jgi:hypothetical protein
MNEILLDMSKKLDKQFCSKAQFIAYFGKCLRFEMRDAVKTGNDNFRIKANITPINQKEIDREKQIEQYLAKIEQQAIAYICSENQLKARLANVLVPLRSYELLSNIRDFEVVGSVVRIYLRTDCNLSQHEKDVVLSQVQSIYSTSELDIESIEYVVENVCNPVSGRNGLQIKQPLVKLILQKDLWGDICQQLIQIYNIHIYNNWFSKLIPIIDKDARTIELKAPNSFIQEEIIKRYGDTIKKVVNELGIKFKGIDRHER